MTVLFYNPLLVYSGIASALSWWSGALEEPLRSTESGPPGNKNGARGDSGFRVSSGPASAALPSALRGSTNLCFSTREYNKAVKRRETVYGSNITVYNPCSTTQTSLSPFPSVYYMPKEAYIVKAHASVSIPGFWPFASLRFISSVSKPNTTSCCWISSTFLETKKQPFLTNQGPRKESRSCV